MSVFVFVWFDSLYTRSTKYTVVHAFHPFAQPPSSSLWCHLVYAHAHKRPLQSARANRSPRCRRSQPQRRCRRRRLSFMKSQRSVQKKLHHAMVRWYYSIPAMTRVERWTAESRSHRSYIYNTIYIPICWRDTRVFLWPHVQASLAAAATAQIACVFWAFADKHIRRSFEHVCVPLSIISYIHDQIHADECWPMTGRIGELESRVVVVACTIALNPFVRSG